MILIKLGGSVITDKSKYRTFNKSTVSRLCREIKNSGKDVVIVHGAGSFGHIVAKEFGLQNGFCDKKQIPAISKVSHDMRELDGMVISEMLESGMPAISIPTGSCFIMEDNDLILDRTEIIERYLDLGMVPVMFGDVVLDRKNKFGICSGDMIMEKLSEILSPECVIFVSDIDGLYESDPKTSNDPKMFPSVNDELLDSIPDTVSVADVTGGVKAKIKSMLNLCSKNRECVLVNGNVHGRLEDLLKGKDVVCTRARRN